MATFKFNGLVTENHTVDLPADIPPGWAHIIVTTESASNQLNAFQAALREVVDAPLLNRSREEIDRELRHERESWE